MVTQHDDAPGGWSVPAPSLADDMAEALVRHGWPRPSDASWGLTRGRRRGAQDHEGRAKLLDRGRGGRAFRRPRLPVGPYSTTPAARVSDRYIMQHNGNATPGSAPDPTTRGLPRHVDPGSVIEPRSLPRQGRDAGRQMLRRRARRERAADGDRTRPRPRTDVGRHGEGALPAPVITRRARWSRPRGRPRAAHPTARSAAAGTGFGGGVVPHARPPRSRGLAPRGEAGTGLRGVKDRCPKLAPAVLPVTVNRPPAGTGVRNSLGPSTDHPRGQAFPP